MFAERLKELRKSKPHLTQTDMAKHLGVAKTTYASYEQGKRTPDAELQHKIADYFGVTLDYLHGREAEKNKGSDNKVQTVAAHIDEDVSDEEMEDIINYIEFIRQKHKKE
ncbi:helix-turn-helix domain-containing protein [Tetragenococcus halophilus]|uniref:Xre family DNA-binding protein n=1 Tax=Tetragenococcus halophilus (strain DSM 20338 / JCM 20259 / NCIMB 9735 / NBRC 12172) TaxID=945021 RepID=A0AAN1VQM8_TETHN|nr:helix-turn-helix transcriptional regulator [Tetragenococcus halophilus]MCO8292621.1 helix-turn-helix transcriptional regulator [Tetragenococcus halophilus]BAK94158.1 putative Xre family DNA-binding protein [Tetragenococcus halophilus NBRC 12172]GBD70795.1 putative Xre family DNA-binding protein [Tetragenococcus halophilus subsp. halophilus]